MWTPDRDAELRRLGVETYISRHPGADVHEVLDRYLLLLDPEGRAALLREKNRDIETGKWTPRRKTAPSQPLPVHRSHAQCRLPSVPTVPSGRQIPSRD